MKGLAGSSASCVLPVYGTTVTSVARLADEEGQYRTLTCLPSPKEHVLVLQTSVALRRQVQRDGNRDGAYRRAWRTLRGFRQRFKCSCLRGNAGR